MKDTSYTALKTEIIYYKSTMAKLNTTVTFPSADYPSNNSNFDIAVAISSHTLLSLVQAAYTRMFI